MTHIDWRDSQAEQRRDNHRAGLIARAGGGGTAREILRILKEQGAVAARAAHEDVAIANALKQVHSFWLENSERLYDAPIPPDESERLHRWLGLTSPERRARIRAAGRERQRRFRAARRNVFINGADGVTRDAPP